MLPAMSLRDGASIGVAASSFSNFSSRTSRSLEFSKSSSRWRVRWGASEPPTIMLLLAVFEGVVAHQRITGRVGNEVRQNLVADDIIDPTGPVNGDE